MDPELLQISRFLGDPALFEQYKNFHTVIKDGLANPNLALIWDRTCAITLRQKPTSDATSLLELAADEALNWATRNSGKEDVTTDSVSTALFKLQTSITQNSEPPHQKEEKLRKWLDRIIIQSASLGEPVAFTANGRGGIEDPTSKALRLAEELRTSRWVYGTENNNPLYFPLDSTELNVLPKVSLGLGPIEDEELAGGPEIGRILLLSGITNVGKSHLALFALSNLCLRRESILIFSGEDGYDLTKKRILTSLLRCPEADTLKFTPEERLQRLRKLYGDENDPESLHHHIRTRFGLYCVPEGGLKLSKIKDDFHRFQDKTQTTPSAFSIDYLQKTQPDVRSGRQQRDEELEDFVNGAKAFSEIEKSLGIIISQVGSGGADGRQSFLTVRNASARSFAATWGADYIVTLNRTIEETERLSTAQTPEDRWPRVNMFLCKNKNGPLGTCYALGLPNQGLWKFFRTKAELERFIKAQKAASG